jgi:ribosomal protein S27E
MLDLTPTPIAVSSGPELAPKRRGVLTAVECCDCRAEFFVWGSAKPLYCAFCGRANRVPGPQDRFIPDLVTGAST